MKELVEKALEEVRPILKRDGGDVELIGVNNEGVVLVKLRGACSGCPSAGMTLRNGIEKKIMERVPGVKSVQSIG
ncbi:MAG: NifU family protein [Nitrospinae bacterium]|nr:NifU family protein [Nitrospinota bacterium]